MRKLTYRQYVLCDCEFCGECVDRKCPHDTCPYKTIEQRKRIPTKIYKKPSVKVVTDETKAPRVLTDIERHKLFPRKSVYEKYNVKHIIFMHLKGYMMVDIARNMNKRPQEIAEVVRAYKKGELDVIL